MAKAIADYNALPAVDRALLDDEQRRSHIRGLLGEDPGPSVLAEEVRRLRAENQALRRYLERMGYDA
jgi:hypothetical protein